MKLHEDTVVAILLAMVGAAALGRWLAAMAAGLLTPGAAP